MLKPVLDPFHRPAGGARRDPHQHDIGKQALLHAEAAAGIRRRTQPETVARHLQRARHHRVQAERPHEIREHVIGVLGRVVFGDQPVGLDRRTGIARIADRHRHAARGIGKRAFRIAVAEQSLAREVRAKAVVQHRLRWIERGQRVDNCGQRLVVDLDQVERVLGEITVGRDDHGHRLADIAHPVDGDRPAFDRRLDADHQAGGEGSDILAGQHDGHAGRVACRLGSDGRDSRMRMRRTQDGGVQRARFHPKVVDETAAPGEQGCVFDALDRLAAPGDGWYCRHTAAFLDVLFRHNRQDAVTVGGAGRYPAVSSVTEKSHFRLGLRPQAPTGEPIRATRRNSLGLTPA